MNRHSIVLLVILVLIGAGMLSLVKIQQGHMIIASGTSSGQGGLVIGGAAPSGGGLVISAGQQGSATQPGPGANAAATSPAGSIELPAAADAAACP